MPKDNNDNIFELYQSKSKNFTLPFGLLLGIGIFFFFFIFIPYISIISKHLDIEKQLILIQEMKNNFTNVEDNIQNFNATFYNDTKILIKFSNKITNSYKGIGEKCKNKEQTFRLIQTPDDKISNIKDDVKKFGAYDKLDICARLNVENEDQNNPTIVFFYNTSFPESKYYAYAIYPSNVTLPSNLISDYTLYKNEISSLEYYNASFYAGSPFWLNNNLRNHISFLFTIHLNDIKLLETNINNLSKTITSNAQLFDKTSLKRLNEISQNLLILNSNLISLEKDYLKIIPKLIPAALSSKPLSTDAFSELSSDIPSKLEQNQPILDNITKAIYYQYDEFNDTAQELSNEDIRLKEKKQETSERLKEIEFPFGKIQISINESIFFFPFGLGISFLICSSLLTDTIILRKTFENNIVNQKNQEKIKNLSIIAPP
jgi:hypothetical protein